MLQEVLEPNAPISEQDLESFEQRHDIRLPVAQPLRSWAGVSRRLSSRSELAPGLVLIVSPRARRRRWATRALSTRFVPGVRPRSLNLAAPDVTAGRLCPDRVRGRTLRRRAGASWLGARSHARPHRHCARDTVARCSPRSAGRLSRTDPHDGTRGSSSRDSGQRCRRRHNGLRRDDHTSRRTAAGR